MSLCCNGHHNLICPQYIDKVFAHKMQNYLCKDRERGCRSFIKEHLQNTCISSNITSVFNRATKTNSIQEKLVEGQYDITK